MKIYFAGLMGAEFRIPPLKEVIQHKRLVSYFYMSESLNKKYFPKSTKRKELENGKTSGA